MDVIVVCADVGSVAKGNFGWWSSHGAEGRKPSEASKHVADLLNEGRSVALGFECPLFVPLASAEIELTNGRVGEGSRAWSAGAGCGALTTGLVEVAWILRSIRAQLRHPVAASLDWEFFSSNPNGLLLWEAFVSGNGKRSSHCEDAEAGAKALLRVLSDPVSANAIKCDGEVYSLVGAALLRTGWSESVGLLNQTCLVMRADRSAL